MTLPTAHKVLIACGALFAGIFGAWSAAAFTSSGAAFDLAAAAVSLAVTLGLLRNLRYFVRKSKGSAAGG